MDQCDRLRQAGFAALLFAVSLRLWSGGLPEKIAAFLAKQDISAFLAPLETGRNVRFSPSLAVFSPYFSESPPAAPTEPPEPEPLPAFSGEEQPELDYLCSARPELSRLLARPLEWNLHGEDPTVLILHTHSTESYTRHREPYRESDPWRTLDENYNMLSVGSRVGQLLAQAGIGVIQDRTLHDYPSYNGSYLHARKSTAAYLEEHPSIKLVLDLHRDASGEAAGQLRTLARTPEGPCAQLMLVLGTNHPHYEDNLSLALKLQVQLERQSPGITRPLQLRSQRFNQDLSPGALLVEVGAAGNSHPEALAAADRLAGAIIALARGSTGPDT